MDKGAFQQTWDVCQKTNLFITIFCTLPYTHIHLFQSSCVASAERFSNELSKLQNFQKFLNPQAISFKKKFLSVVKQSEISIEAFVC